MKLVENWKAYERKIARKYLIEFIQYMKPGLAYRAQWFHKVICEKIDALIRGDFYRLMIFTPPQHGKSEIVSRMLPAFLLGLDPDTKMTVASYAQSLARQFNRETQRIIDSERYRAIFPRSILAGMDTIDTDSFRSVTRTASAFEMHEALGGLVSVGVGSGLTGRPVDFGIIDDPVKDADQAYSEVYRDKVWEWYTHVLKTRLHNESKIAFTMTRWHDDDLAGRIEKIQDESEERWETIIFPAIKEGPPNQHDPRYEGEALWEERHSAKRILAVKKISEKVFNSLYQQVPAPKEGNRIKEKWFGRFLLSDLEHRAYDHDKEIIWDFTIDGAYTDKDINDPTAILAFCRIFNCMYVREVAVVRMEMPDLLRFIPEFVYRNGYKETSRIWIEPNASGRSVAQMVKANTKLNIIIDKAPEISKEARVEKCSPYMESGRVFLLEGGSWVNDYLYELKMFSNTKHDDQVDVTTMAIDKDFDFSSEIYDMATI